MRDSRIIIDKNIGTPKDGYTLKIYAYSTGNTSGYSGSALYTYTDHGDGSYSVDVTTSVVGTVVITTPNGTVLVPANLKGKLFVGDTELSS